MSAPEARPIFPKGVWILAFAAAGLAPGFVGDLVWSPWSAGVGVLIGAALGIACGALRRTDPSLPFGSRTSLGMTSLLGAGLGLLAWLFSLGAWLALETVLGDKGLPLLYKAAGAAFGAVVGLVLAWVLTRRTSARRELYRLLFLRAAILVVLVLCVLYLLMTGPHDLDRYPDAHASSYRLPWPGGVTRLCCQSNRGVVSHRGWSEFAYDFAMPVGSPVCAARGGIVTHVEIEHDGRGLHSPNNYIGIAHGDGTSGWYHHLRQDGAYVTLGQTVQQGDRIAASGNVGLSWLPHLHFHVTDQKGNMLRVTFADVDSDRGIPRALKRYTSGNAPLKSSATEP